MFRHKYTKPISFRTKSTLYDLANL